MFSQSLRTPILIVCTSLCACSEVSSGDDASLGLGPAPDAQSDAPPPPSPGCAVVEPTACPEPPLTYADVEPIFAEHCHSCHSGEPDGPWPLTDYAHIALWSAEIRAAMLSCTMPPADAGVVMPAEERERIVAWIHCGYPP